MVNHQPVRVVLMFLGLFTFSAAIIFNSLSGFGPKSGQLSGHVFVLVGGHTELCVSPIRCFQAEHRRRPGEVCYPHKPSSMDPVRVGLHLHLGFCHVYILCRGPLSEVGPCIHSLSFYCCTQRMTPPRTKRQFIFATVLLFLVSCCKLSDIV